MRERQHRGLQLASRIYGLCVRLTPHRFRERFGPESEDAFRHLLEDTFRSRGACAAVTTAAAACGDVAHVAVAERVTGWRSAFFSGLTGDLTQAIRIYWREPILAAALALTLALVTGPGVAIFSVLYQMVLAPLPYPDADRLVVVAQHTASGPFSYLPVASVADYGGVQAFSMAGGIRPLGSTVVMRGQPERVPSFQTTAGLLTGLGVPFAAGRDLRRGEAEVVVTRGFARSRFGGETAALGQTLSVNQQSLTIVGVLAYAPPLPASRGGELFIPNVTADQAVPDRRARGQVIVIARLRPDSDTRLALVQAKAIAANVRAQFGGPEVTPDIVSLRTMVSGSLRGPLLALFAVVVVVFLISVTSLATLVLARAAAHASDVAVRTSLGASRWRLIRSWLLDGTVLSLPGLTLGAWLGEWLLRYGQSSLPRGVLPLPETHDLAPIIVAATALAVATAVLFGGAPMAAGLLRPPSVALRDMAGSVAGLRRMRSQSVLIAGQIALSLVLVTSAVWLSTSLFQMLSRPVGFDPENLVTIHTQSAQPRHVQIDAARRVLPRLQQLIADRTGGVATTSSLPGVNADVYVPLRIRADQPVLGEDDRPQVARAAVSTGYFHVLGVRLLQGRYFNRADEAVPERAVILSRSFAARWFPEGAIGGVVSLGRDDWREVVGIVEDVHAGRLSQDSVPQFYVPMTEPTLGGPSWYVMRTSRSIDDMRADVTSIVREADPTASVVVISAEDAMALPLALQRMANQLTIGMALLALLLAIVNVYALSAFAVIQRTREIGLRVALGSSAVNATRLVMRRGLVWIGVGLVLGSGLTRFLAAPLLEQQLFQTKTGDPRFLALAFLAVTGVALIASWVPARRAARIDPAIALRSE